MWSRLDPGERSEEESTFVTEGETPLLADEIRVIDADSHVTEPPDLWTSRLGKELLDYSPRVLYDERRSFDRWWIGRKRLGGVAASAYAGWHEPMPAYPPTLAEAHPGSWNPVERLKALDEYGVWAQVLYPNLLGFQQYAFLSLPEPLRSECVKAYNDFLIDFTSEDPRRFIPILFVPYWDIDFALSEIKRGAAAGHKGALFPSAFFKQGLPMLSEGYWNPVYALCQDIGMSLNFHTAFQSHQADLNTMTCPACESGVKVVWNGALFSGSPAWTS
jgi:predicted TIM-barrel fold metal-dependent hydrolase